MIDMSKKDKPYEEIKRDREVLIDWIEEAEKNKATLISKYEETISQLELRIEELEAPRFTYMDAAKAEEMISNTQQPVTDAYRNNPFWDRNKEENVELDYEAELVLAMNGIDESDPEVAHGTADKILIEALKHNGWDRLVDSYKDLVGRCSWWACA